MAGDVANVGCFLRLSMNKNAANGVGRSGDAVPFINGRCHF